MLREKSIYYYKKGFNCSQCLLKACEQVYGINISKQSMKLCSAVNNGFGIGNICSVLISGIMIFGLLFDENTAKKLRIELLTKFKENHSLNCISLKKEFNANNCENIIGEIADIVENIIYIEKNRPAQ